MLSVWNTRHPLSKGFLKVLIAGLFTALLVAGLLLGGSAKAHAADGPIKVFIDTKELHVDIEPNLNKGTTLVQMRPIFEALGMELKWDSATKQISAKKEGISLSMTLGSSTATVNGERVQLTRPPEAIKGHTVVPLRFISEVTGAFVHWNSVGREIVVLTEPFIASLGMTKEEMKKYVEELQKEIDEKHVESKPDPAPSNKTPNLSKVNPNQLKGMYYGFEPDFDGYRCGGMCWKFYTFLPDQKILVGEPAGGGPETIDCKVDRCLSYKINNGTELVIAGGDTLSIGLNSKNALVINGAVMTPVVPAPADLKLSGKYITQGYSGLVGISPAATSWTKTITFSPEGKFESDSLSIGVLNTGDAHTSGSQSGSLSGTYSIKGNTITLQYSDGTKQKHIFIPEDKKNGVYMSIQLGDENYRRKD